jgi:hypothetical protein
MSLDALWNEFVNLLLLQKQYLDLWQENTTNYCRVGVTPDRLYLFLNLNRWTQESYSAIPHELTHTEYLRIVSHIIELQRQQGRLPTLEELIAIRIAYSYLGEGGRLDQICRPWGNSGFRDHQTYMSITDPGEGHLHGTTTNNAYLDGVIVHIEHLERGTMQDREAVEPYRIPANHTLAKVRLHVGNDAPCSSYVGRPIFEGDVRSSLLKTVHTVAAACSSIFMDGLSECKIAIERMTAMEAIEFMQAIVGGVQRNRYQQCLSAAFNINTPIVDDRPATLRENGGKPRLVTSRFDIGMLGIELAKAGGFDKVTWDGAANTYPSLCVIEQLSFEEALTLVHRAHEEGLLTYFSAGFRFHHIAQVVHTGVDGVGIGGAQILRYMDKKTGYHGPFQEENIPTILRLRDEAEWDVRGQAVRLLCRLDRMAFEGSISRKDEVLRQTLFTHLKNGDEEALHGDLAMMQHMLALPADTCHPLIGYALRLIRGGFDCIAAESFSHDEWLLRLHWLQRHVYDRDLEHLAEALEYIRQQRHGRTLQTLSVA